MPLCWFHRIHSAPALGCGSRARQSLPAFSEPLQILWDGDVAWRHAVFGLETGIVVGVTACVLCGKAGNAPCLKCIQSRRPASARAGYSLQRDFVHYLTPVFPDRSLPSAETGAVYWGQLHSSVMGAGMSPAPVPMAAPLSRNSSKASSKLIHSPLCIPFLPLKHLYVQKAP